MAGLNVQISGMTLDNPVIPASGTFGFGYEFAAWYDINLLGSIALKGATKAPRIGNGTPRIAETPGGMLNAIGLQNPGIDRVIDTELVRLAAVYKKPVIANIGGFTADEFAYCCAAADAAVQIGMIELNISCPNLHGGGVNFGSDPRAAAEITAVAKRHTKKPVFVKLSPNVTDITEVARACEAAGADGLCCINTLVGMRIDLRRRRPLLHNRIGGLSGRAVFPVALRAVYQVYDAVQIPVIGVGGIASAEDVLEMMLAGASAVEVGTANLIDPYACKKIIEALPETLKRFGFSTIQDCIGGAH